ncbi:hypothetical protein C5167_050257 [Papaver somniferum]|uniref:Uncharacterized protein n=1 Tax=Papaver somniferum TaxID=3469 RepID=A0A4Y7KN60_PAPSO|nr:hypothetical protein C5167_050257 [Papaver somniferum]
MFSYINLKKGCLPKVFIFFVHRTLSRLLDHYSGIFWISIHLRTNPTSVKTDEDDEILELTFIAYEECVLPPFCSILLLRCTRFYLCVPICVVIGK